jgi:hypothetical protein
VAIGLTAGSLLPGPLEAQQTDEQVWLQINENVQLAPTTRFTLEQIARLGDRPGGLYTTEFGGLLSQRIGKGIELGVGYRHVSFHNGNNADDEDRLRQQVVATSGRFMVRLRLDERFHPDGDEIGFRVRPMVRYNHPLNGRGMALFAFHESFYLLNETSWGQRRGYDRMRNSAGLTLKVASGLSADIGYLNQFRPARNGARAQMDHALSLQLTINFGDIGHHSGSHD